MKIQFLFTALLLTLACAAQQVVQMDVGPCGIHGKATKSSPVYALNALKNRYKVPADSDYDSTITLDRLLNSADPNAFSTDSAVMIQGYVYNVKVGGIESCNCKTKSVVFRDTHIELTPSADDTDAAHKVIVEVSPRLRAMMKRKGENWSTAALKKALIGHTVKVGGWLLYDAEHETEAFANDPQDQVGRKNWRGTCWEVHPITSLTVLQ